MACDMVGCSSVRGCAFAAVGSCSVVVWRGCIDLRGGVGSSSGLLALCVVSPGGRGVSAAGSAASSWRAEPGGDLYGPVGGGTDFVVSASWFRVLGEVIVTAGLWFGSSSPGFTLYSVVNSSRSFVSIALIVRFGKLTMMVSTRIFFVLR